LKIDNYIRDRIIFADEVIQELAGKKIKDGDVILTYAKFVMYHLYILGSIAYTKKILDCGKSIAGSPRRRQKILRYCR